MDDDLGASSISIDLPLDAATADGVGGGGIASRPVGSTFAAVVSAVAATALGAVGCASVRGAPERMIAIVVVTVMIVALAAAMAAHIHVLFFVDCLRTRPAEPRS